MFLAWFFAFAAKTHAKNLVFYLSLTPSCTRGYSCLSPSGSVMRLSAEALYPSLPLFFVLPKV